MALGKSISLVQVLKFVLSLLLAITDAKKIQKFVVFGHFGHGNLAKSAWARFKWSMSKVQAGMSGRVGSIWGGNFNRTFSYLNITWIIFS